jgi:hypothetical protein
MCTPLGFDDRAELAGSLVLLNSELLGICCKVKTLLISFTLHAIVQLKPRQLCTFTTNSHDYCVCGREEMPICFLAGAQAQHCTVSLVRIIPVLDCTLCVYSLMLLVLVVLEIHVRIGCLVYRSRRQSRAGQCDCVDACASCSSLQFIFKSSAADVWPHQCRIVANRAVSKLQMNMFRDYGMAMSLLSEHVRFLIH